MKKVKRSIFMPKSDRYYCHNRRKYYLKAHIVLVTKYRKPLLSGNVSSGVKTIFYTVAEKNGAKSWQWKQMLIIFMYYWNTILPNASVIL